MRRAPLICTLTLLGACSDPPDQGTETQARPHSLALVSSSVAEPGGSNTAVVGGYAYVSMVPGTDGDGRRVDVRNLRGGASATSPMWNGGFDPIAVEAEAGDTLSITVFHQAGNDTTTYGVVPIRSRPTVIRTSPASGKTDVPLNSVILVVFNQPMDSTSVAVALRLQHEGIDVPGRVSMDPTGGVILTGQFVPDGPLAPLSTYALSVATEARSSDGISLDAALTIEFTTSSSAGVSRLRVVHAEPRAGLMDVFVDKIKVLSDMRFPSTADYMELPSGAHELWFETHGGPISAGRMDEFRGSLAAGADYTAFPCCAYMGIFGNVMRDDNSPPPAGKARIRVVDYASFDESVNVYVTSPGADLAASAPMLIGILGATNYIDLAAGDYQIRLTPWDSDSVAIDGTMTLSAGQVRTVVAVDAPGWGPPYGLFVLDDRN